MINGQDMNSSVVQKDQKQIRNLDGKTRSCSLKDTNKRLAISGEESWGCWRRWAVSDELERSDAGIGCGGAWASGGGGRGLSHECIWKHPETTVFHFQHPSKQAALTVLEGIQGENHEND